MFISDNIYPEDFLISCLQQYLTFYIGGRLVKRGRLVLFKRQHYYIQLSMINDKQSREHFELPIPFNVEMHPEDSLAYFDYRLNSLKVNSLPIIPQKVSSSFFNKILEVNIS